MSKAADTANTILNMDGEGKISKNRIQHLLRHLGFHDVTSKATRHGSIHLTRDNVMDEMWEHPEFGDKVTIVLPEGRDILRSGENHLESIKAMLQAMQQVGTLEGRLNGSHAGEAAVAGTAQRIR